ncbi:cache domain-containing sensor histidine kinase [Paenibacillus sp. IITD108]|uniref:cache domain-containing sensor histidine kinase n=1 Tax=Paenibacillus sp. IITD108 TaxID=3116649 RepID=UPI002F4054EC
MMRGSLVSQLFFYFLVVISLSLISLGFFTYSKSSKELETLNDQHLEQIVNNALNHTDLYVMAYERSMLSLLTDRNMKKFIDLPSSPDPYDYYHYSNELKDVGFSPIFIRDLEVNSIYAISFSGNGVYGFNNGMNVETFSAKTVQSHLRELLDITKKDGSVSFVTSSIFPSSNNHVVRLARQIKGLASPEYRGVLAIEINADELSTLWHGIDLGENGYFFITDERGRIVYHPQSSKMGQQIDSSLSVQLSDPAVLSFTDIDEEGEERVYVKRTSNHTQWSLVASVPVGDLKKPISNIRMTTIQIAVLTLIFALWISYQFGRSITRPIKVLKRGMTYTEKGNWFTIPLPKRRNEISELMERYNVMVRRLSELVEQVYESELRQKEAQYVRQKTEFQSLQMQINPHFLYNTLETITCYAAIQDSDEIQEIVKSMAYMLRYSVQTNIEEITVANELNHVLNYMVILKHRTEREFELDVAIPPQYLLRKMVRLTLQPLIENVFQHAFPDSIEEHHWVRIDAGEQDGMFWLSVEDNGAGISEEKLRLLEQRLQHKENSDEMSESLEWTGGIGLANVHRRIQMVFGEQCGLKIESKHGEGTKMTMMMPIASMPIKPKRLQHRSEEEKL